MTIQERLKAPLPKFFRQVQRIALLVIAAGLLVLTGPARVPVVVEVLAANLVTAGLVAAAVSQATVGGKTNKSKRNGRFTRQR